MLYRMLLFVVMFVGLAASEDATILPTTNSSSSLATPPRNLVVPCELTDNRPPCDLESGTFMIEAVYQGTPGTFDIATTALGKDADAPEIYHLQPFQNDLSNGMTYHGCFEKNSLYRFVVYLEQLESNQAKFPDGEYNLTVNGRQLVSSSTQSTPESFTEYFFVGDSQGCTGGLFAFTIQFDQWPFEITWELESDQTLALTYESTLKNNSSKYSSDFEDALLFVDHCLHGGSSSMFHLYDEAGDGMLAPSFYEITASGQLVVRQEGYFGGIQTHSFLSDGTTITDSPTSIPSSAPSPEIFLPPGVAFDPPTSQDIVIISVQLPKLPSQTPVSFPEKPPGTLAVSVNFGGACFTASTTVSVKDKGNTKMSDLAIGEYIAVGSDIANGGYKYERIYSFGHHSPDGHATGFLELFTNHTKTRLQVSPDHLVFIYKKARKRGRQGGVAAVPAATIRVGDLLVYSDKGAALVESVKHLFITESAGMYAPFTPSGTFLVNDGLFVSSFIGFARHAGQQPDADGWLTPRGLMLLGVDLLSYHWLSRSFEFPHRVVCYYLSTCPNETYTTGGLSTWTEWPLEMALHLLNMEPGFLTAILWCNLLLVCCVFTVTEYVLFQRPMVLVVILATLWMLSKARHNPGKRVY